MNNKTIPRPLDLHTSSDDTQPHSIIAKYTLLIERNDKMAGYWPSSFLDRDDVVVNEYT